MFHLAQRIIPQHFLTRLAGYVAYIRIALIKNTLIRWFIQYYQVDLSLSQIEDLRQFEHFNAFFTRALKPELRPITPGDQIIISPADCTISQLGALQHDQILQAKNQTYSVQTLVGDPQQANAFRQGQFITLYLAPKDYHRVHMPIAGTLKSIRYIPGKLFSVNQKTAQHIPNLFTRNERMVCLFETQQGKLAVIFVGAMIVGHIETNWLNSAQCQSMQTVDFSDQNISVKKGVEIGHFRLGSTVILLFERNQITFQPDLVENKTLCMGESIGHLNRLTIHF